MSTLIEWQRRVRETAGGRGPVASGKRPGNTRRTRFVSGFVGEQYAVPEAVEVLRAVRRSHADPERVVIAAADPLDLVGILTPGSRVSPYSNQAILYRDGHLWISVHSGRS